MGDRDRGERPWRWAAIALGLALLAVGAPRADARAAASPKSAVLVLDANSGRVLYQSSADEPRHPASLAKMMTIYLALELIEQGRLSYQTKIRFSANAAAAAPSKLDVEEGEEITLLEAIRLLITKSANDVAVAIAEHIAGSEERFARLMTHKAHQLGMAATTFRNASGLPDDAQVTTARDMVTLALRLQDDFPRHYPLFATRTAAFKDEIFQNHNTLLLNYEGTDGLKTGYTRASGFNLVASVRRGKKHVIGAIFGGASAASRNAAMRTFLNIGLVKASSEKTRRPAPLLIARPAAPKPQRAARPAAQPVAVPPSPEAAQVPASPSPASSATLPIEIARVRPVSVAVAPPATAAPPPDRPAFFFDPTLARGAPPSTLGEQAANIERGGSALTPPATTAALPAPRSPEASSATRGAFQIQVGAYQNQAEAERQLSAVRERAGAVLARSAPVTQQVQQGQKVLYRARYSGFDAGAAQQACSEIKKLKIDCLVVRAE